LVEKTATETEIRWLDSVLAGLDDASIIWSPREMHEATTRPEN
jgi:hypothetical protein